MRLELADGLDRLIADNLELKVDARDVLEGVHNERTCGAQARGGLTGHHGASGMTMAPTGPPVSCSLVRAAERAGE